MQASRLKSAGPMPKSRIARLNYEAHMQCTCNGQLRCIHCNKQFAFRSFAGHFLSHKPVLSACQCVPWPVSLRAATRELCSRGVRTGTRPAAVLCEYLNSLLLSWLQSEATELASLMRDEVNKFKGNVCRHKCVFATCSSRQSVHGLRAAAALASPAVGVETSLQVATQAHKHSCAVLGHLLQHHHTFSASGQTSLADYVGPGPLEAEPGWNQLPETTHPPPPQTSQEQQVAAFFRPARTEPNPEGREPHTTKEVEELHLGRQTGRRPVVPPFGRGLHAHENNDEASLGIRDGSDSGTVATCARLPTSGVRTRSAARTPSRQRLRQRWSTASSQPLGESSRT